MQEAKKRRRELPWQTSARRAGSQQGEGEGEGGLRGGQGQAGGGGGGVRRWFIQYLMIVFSLSLSLFVSLFVYCHAFVSGLYLYSSFFLYVCLCPALT